MAIEKTGKTHQKQPTQQLKGSVKDFEKKQQALAAQYIDPPKTKADLEHNAKLKQQQITLARQNNRMDLVQTLTNELNAINKDIKRNESMNSSVFDDNKEQA